MGTDQEDHLKGYCDSNILHSESPKDLRDVLPGLRIIAASSVNGHDQSVEWFTQQQHDVVGFKGPHNGDPKGLRGSPRSPEDGGPKDVHDRDPRDPLDGISSDPHGLSIDPHGVPRDPFDRDSRYPPDDGHRDPHD